MSKRYSEKEKLRLVSGWAQSGESRVSCAKRHGISAGSLARWQAGVGPAMEGGGVRFVEVEVPPMAAAEGSKPVAAGVVVAELVLPGGACVRFFSREGAC